EDEEQFARTICIAERLLEAVEGRTRRPDLVRASPDKIVPAMIFVDGVRTSSGSRRTHVSDCAALLPRERLPRAPSREKWLECWPVAHERAGRPVRVAKIPMVG